MVGLGYRFSGEAADIEANITRITTQELDVASLMGKVREKFEEDWASNRLEVNPRDFVTQAGVKPGVKICRYKHWMGETRHTQIYIPRAWHVSMMRFRMGVWMIEANNPRGAQGAHRERAQRVCPGEGGVQLGLDPGSRCMGPGQKVFGPLPRSSRPLICVCKTTV